jgi:hypothetical protein
LLGREAESFSSGGVSINPPAPGILIIQREGYPWNVDDTIFKSLAPQRFGQAERVVELTEQEADGISELLDFYHGISHDIGADKQRMIYFSTVVITTLGLGDIVPLTPGLRWWVASEATLGILLLGVLVSPLSRVPSRPQK